MVRNLNGMAAELYDAVKDAPIVSPHGHCDPAWFATDAPFHTPADLLVIPDHYVFRMLHSQGVALQDLGIGVAQDARDPRRIFHLFAQHWHLFLGTPSRLWIEYVLHDTMGISTPLGEGTADEV